MVADIKDAERAAREILKANHYARVLVSEMDRIFFTHNMRDDHNWVPVFSESAQRTTGDWILKFINVEEDSVTRDVHVDLSQHELLNALNFMKKQHENLKEGFERDEDVEGLMRAREHVDEGILKDAAFALSNLNIVHDYVRSSHFEQPKRSIESALDVWAWVSFFNIPAVGGAMFKANWSLVRSAMAGFESAKWTFGNIAGTGLTVGLVIFNIYSLVKAIKEGNGVEVAVAATALTLGVISGSVGFTATVASVMAFQGVAGAATVSAFATGLGIPLAGLTIGISALVKNISANTYSSLEAMRYIYRICKAYDQHGYDIDEHGYGIPRVDANIIRLDYRKGEIEFGETRIKGNYQGWSGSLNHTGKQTSYDDVALFQSVSKGMLDEWVSIRAGTRACHDLEKIQYREVLVLPPGGDIDLDYKTIYVGTSYALRGDTELDWIRRLKPKFYFSCDLIAVAEITRTLRSKTVKVLLDSKKPRTLVMPPSKAYYNDTNWTVTYELVGNGGQYAVLTHGKGGAHLHIREDGPVKSNWMLEAGEDEGDSITDITHEGFRYGDVRVELSDGARAVVLSGKKLYTVENGKKSFYGLNNAWLGGMGSAVYSLREEKMFDSFAAVAEDEKVDFFFVSDAKFSPPDNIVSVNIFSSGREYVHGFYLAKTKEFCFFKPNTDDLIYSCTSEHVRATLWGVSPTWVEKQLSLFSSLVKLSAKKVHLTSFQHPNLPGGTLSGVYLAESGTIIATFNEHTIYTISNDFRIRLTAFIASPNASLEDIAQHLVSVGGNKFGGYEPVFPVFGTPEALWFVPAQKKFLRGPEGSNLVGELDGLYILHLKNKLYAQDLGTDVHQHQIFEKLGAIKTAHRAGSRIVVEAEDDLHFVLLGIREGERAQLFKTGEYSRASWAMLSERESRGEFEIAEMAYSYWPLHFYHKQTHTRFIPNNEMLKDDPEIENFVYIGHETEKYVKYGALDDLTIYLFNKKVGAIYALRRGNHMDPYGTSIKRAAKDVIRIGQVLAVEGHAWEKGWDEMGKDEDAFRYDTYRLNMDGVESFILRATEGGHPHLAWPRQYGFKRMILEVPESVQAAKGLELHVPDSGDIRRDGVNLNIIGSDEGTLSIVDVTANEEIYSTLMIRIGTEEPINAYKVYLSAI